MPDTWDALADSASSQTAGQPCEMCRRATPTLQRLDQQWVCPECFALVRRTSPAPHPPVRRVMPTILKWLKYAVVVIVVLLILGAPATTNRTATDLLNSISTGIGICMLLLIWIGVEVRRIRKALSAPGSRDVSGRRES
jgi:hypothetical protein